MKTVFISLIKIFIFLLFLAPVILIFVIGLDEALCRVGGLFIWYGFASLLTVALTFIFVIDDWVDRVFKD